MACGRDVFTNFILIQLDISKNLCMPLLSGERCGPRASYFLFYFIFHIKYLG